MRKNSAVTESFPALIGVALDTTNARALAEFYRQLVGYEYRSGDAPPSSDEADERGADWLVLLGPPGSTTLAFQQVAKLARSTWPEDGVPQQLHLDLTVQDVEGLATQHGRALSLGAVLLEDRSQDPVEPLYVYADPDGHPFCIFVSEP
jgi:catechol 2,3-dioxygenase-like lactoylglutathione lyase family enzyme